MDKLPTFFFASALPAGYSLKSVGHGNGYLPCGAVGVLEYFVVTLPSGSRVPASRWVEVGHEFNITQDAQYVLSGE